MGSSGGVVAGVAGGGGAGPGGGGGAEVGGVRAAVAEDAAGREVPGGGDCAGDCREAGPGCGADPGARVAGIAHVDRSAVRRARGVDRSRRGGFQVGGGEEALGVAVAGVGEDLVDGAGLDDAAAVHDEDAFADGGDDG